MVNWVVKNCWLCKINKGKPYVTGAQRSREYDGPFRYLVIDYVGPQRPPSKAGNEYMFTCACGFSWWYWCVPTPDDTSATAARCLAERVMFDIAGVPVMLGSDRAPAFVRSVVKDLAGVFGMERVLGTAYHPEAQSAVEGPHREYKALCRAYMREFQDWDRIAPLFQWTVRTTANIFNASFTPYETVLGLKPRPLRGAQRGVPSCARKPPVGQCVKDLVEYLKHVHQHVAEQHHRVRTHEAEQRFREAPSGRELQVGDYVLLTRGHPQSRPTSERAQARHHETLYQIVHAAGTPHDVHRAFTICEAATGKTDDLGFAQPVSADRLVPVEVLPMARPDGEGHTQLECAGRRGEIMAQAVDGSVHIQWADTPLGTWEHLDLERLAYRWLD